MSIHCWYKKYAMFVCCLCMSVEGTQYLVSLVKNNDGEFLFATFKSASEVKIKLGKLFEGERDIGFKIHTYR